MGRKRQSYSGDYIPKDRSKYVGTDVRKAHYRSLWERGFCKWCDKNPKVVKWAIEPFFINYFDKGRGKYRKYYPDFYVKMDSGAKYLIEIKPDYETRPPKMREGTKKHMIAESTWMTNTCKWETANIYCEQKGMSFKVVTEHTLKKLGIKLIGKPPRYKKRKKGTSKKKIKYTNRKASSGLK